MVDDIFDSLDKAEEKQKKGKVSEYDNPIVDVPKSKIRKMSKQGKATVHGKYIQITFRLPDVYLDEIEDIARAERLPKEQIKRWVVGMGIAAYRSGQLPKLKATSSEVDLPGVKD